MGAEANCAITVNAVTRWGKARLETVVLSLRAADLKLDVPISEMKNVKEASGELTFKCRDGVVGLQLGPAAAKWADKILHPPSRIAKLGIKPGFRVSFVGTIDRAFVAEVRSAGAHVAQG